MNLQENRDRLGERLRAAALAAQPPLSDLPAARFAARLREVASHRERVPIRIDGAKLEARLDGTILAAALRGGVRLMHVCGARTLCSTCRVKVEAGAENLSAMTAKEKLSLRYHLALGSDTRLACQARVSGPVEVNPIFPLCGSLAGD